MRRRQENGDDIQKDFRRLQLRDVAAAGNDIEMRVGKPAAYAASD